MGSSQSKTQTQRRRPVPPSRHGRFAPSPPAPLGLAPAPAMPSFFSFQQGSETVQNIRYGTETSPLLGRFRAVPRPSDDLNRSSSRRTRSSSQLGLLSAGWRGSVHVGYGALIAAGLEAAASEEGDDGDDEDESESDAFLPGGSRSSCFARRIRRIAKRLNDTWVDPKASVVRRTVDLWWSRWGVLVVLPAALVSLSPVPYRGGKAHAVSRQWVGVPCRSLSIQFLMKAATATAMPRKGSQAPVAGSLATELLASR